MRIFDKATHQKPGDYPDWKIDEKNPAPGIVKRDPAAQRRSDRRRHNGCDAVQREGQTSLVRGKGVCKNGLSHRLQTSSACSLQHAEQQQKAETWRQAAEQGTHGEDSETAHEKTFATQ